MESIHTCNFIDQQESTLEQATLFFSVNLLKL